MLKKKHEEEQNQGQAHEQNTKLTLLDYIIDQSKKIEYQKQDKRNTNVIMHVNNCLVIYQKKDKPQNIQLRQSQSENYSGLSFYQLQDIYDDKQQLKGNTRHLNLQQMPQQFSVFFDSFEKCQSPNNLNQEIQDPQNNINVQTHTNCVTWAIFQEFSRMVDLRMAEFEARLDNKEKLQHLNDQLGTLRIIKTEARSEERLTTEKSLEQVKSSKNIGELKRRKHESLPQNNREFLNIQSVYNNQNHIQKKSPILVATNISQTESKSIETENDDSQQLYNNMKIERNISIQSKTSKGIQSQPKSPTKSQMSHKSKSNQ